MYWGWAGRRDVGGDRIDMLVVGLTGGIGSGKSTVAALFAALGVPVIDADVIAREVIATDNTLLEKITAHFGVEVLDRKGQLDRAKLGSYIFQDSTQRQWLEQLLHPKIIAEIKQRLLKLRVSDVSVPYCIVVIPLLAEVPETQKLVDRILVVDVSEALQTTRIIERDQLSPQAVERILASQGGRAQRLQIADDVLSNAGNIQVLEQAVLQLNQQYLLTRST